MTVNEWLDNDQLAIDIFNKKYRNGNESFDDWLNRVSGNDPVLADFIRNKKAIFGGRTLANRGTNNGSYSNCYSIGFVEDSLESIFDTNTKIGLTFKAQGGQGLSLTLIRPKGSLIKNKFESDGIVPFMEMFNTTTASISQGSHRRGALLMSIDIWHKEAKEFITIKSDLKKINNANLSLEIDDDFMSDVVEYYKTGEVRKRTIKRIYGYNIIEYEVTPIKLYKLLCEHALKYAEPGILYVNRMRHYNLMQFHPEYRIETCNPCQPAYATVLTPKGLSSIGKINEGEFIWSSEGWTRVVKKWSTGNKDVYKYRTSRGLFIGTENHRLVSKGVKVEAKDCEFVDSLVGDYKERDFPFIPTIVMDGLVLGDGFVHKASNNLVLLCIGENDQDYFNSEIKDFIGIKREGVSKCAYEVQTSIKAYELPRKWDLEIPSRFMEANKQIVCSLLRGLYSANGSVVRSRKTARITYKTTSPKLRDQIQILLSILGIHSYYTTNREHTSEFANGVYTCKESYDINITSDRYKFMNLIGFIQEYKTRKVGNTGTVGKEIITGEIIDKTYLGNEEVFNITVSNSTHTYWTGGLNVSNCSEQPLPKHGACNLCSINLSEFILNPYTDNSLFDFIDLERVVKALVLAMDKIIDENADNHALIEQKNMAQNYRNIGIGVMGLHDCLSKLRLVYGSSDSISMASRIMRFIFRTAVLESSRLGKILGSFPKYDPSVWRSDIIKNAFSKDEIDELIKNNALRNCSLITVAPTGSIGTMFGVSTGVEPYFALKYNRRTVSLNGEEQTYSVNIKALDDYHKITGNNDIPEYFNTSASIGYNDRIAMQAALQDYCDTAISSTINLPKGTTQDTIEDIYIKAWEAGLKGVTVYVDGSRDPILSTTSPSEVPSTTPPKRPQVLPCDIYKVKAKGEIFIVCVGLYNDKPYEIFVFRPSNDVSLTTNKGTITKVKKGVYNLKSDDLDIANLLNTDISIEEKAATLYSSMLLRHGVSIKYIIKTAKKVNDNITSFSSAMCRVLSKYIPSEIVNGKCPECGSDLINEGGCVHCSSCLYSKCE